MNLLLDTQSFLWHALADNRLPQRLRVAIENGENDLYLSAASLWEAAIKIRIGKLHVPGGSVDFLVTTAQSAGVHLLPIAVDHIRQTESLPMLHRDPFDRMLVAQAMVEKLILITTDTALHAYPVATL